MESAFCRGGKNADRYLLVNVYAAVPSEECLSAFVLPEDNDNNRIFVGIHCYFNNKNINKQFANIRKYSEKYNFVIGEFAFYNDEENVDNTVKEFVSIADELNIPVFWWDDGTNSKFGLLDRTKLEWSHRDLLSALIGK